MKLFKTDSSIVSVYIGLKEIKIIAQGQELSASLPEGVISEGIVVDTAAAASIIRDLIKSKGISAEKAVTAVSSRSVVLRLMRLASLAPDMLKDVIKKEFSKYMVFAGDDFFVDYCSLGESKEEGQSSLNVLAAAVKKEVIDSYVETIRLAGLSLQAISVSSLIVARAALFKNLLPEGVAVLAAVEENNSTVFIFKDGKIHYLHSINSLKQLDAEMEATTAYCRDKFGKDTVIKKVISTDIKGLSIAQALNLWDVKGEGPDLKINLLPLEEIKVKELERQALLFLEVLGGVVGLLIFFFLFLHFQTWVAYRNIASSQQALSRPDPAFSQLLSTESASRQYALEIRSQEAVAAAAKGQNWHVILEEIKRIIPKRAFLLSLITNREGLIEFEGEAADPDTAFDFVRSLKASKYFDDVKLEETKDMETIRGMNAYFIIRGRLTTGVEK